MVADNLSPPAGTASRRKLTPPQYAKQLGIDQKKVIKWIRSGELKAIDACTRRGSKPRYLIDLDAIAAFEAARAVQPPAPRARRQRRRGGFVEYV